MNDPRYEHRLAVLESRLHAAERRLAKTRLTEGKYPWLRLGTLLIGLVGVYLAFSLLSLWLAWSLAFLFLGGFVIVTLAHRRVILAIDQYTALVELAAARLARARIDWAHIPAPFGISVPPEHPFNRDLLVTGERSLHQLLNSATSVGGSLKLADWLLCAQPDPQVVTARQRAVRELLRSPGLRARMAVDGSLAAGKETRWDGEPLIHWIDQRSQASSLKNVLIVLAVLAGLDLVLLTANFAGLLPPLWIATFLVYFGIQSYRFRELSEVFGESYDLAHRLGQIKMVLTRLEAYPFTSGGELARICTPLRSGSERPSMILRRIERIASAASIHGNPFLSLVLNILMPWDLFFAYQLERFKVRLRLVLPGWLKAWYEMEALSSLAEFSYQNPSYTFPSLNEIDAAPVFEAQSLGHPLIPYPARSHQRFPVRSPRRCHPHHRVEYVWQEHFLEDGGSQPGISFLRERDSGEPAGNPAVPPVCVDERVRFTLRWDFLFLCRSSPAARLAGRPTRPPGCPFVLPD